MSGFILSSLLRVLVLLNVEAPLGAAGGLAPLGYRGINHTSHGNGIVRCGGLIRWNVFGN